VPPRTKISGPAFHVLKAACRGLLYARPQAIPSELALQTHSKATHQSLISTAQKSNNSIKLNIFDNCLIFSGLEKIKDGVPAGDAVSASFKRSDMKGNTRSYSEDNCSGGIGILPDGSLNIVSEKDRGSNCGSLRGEGVSMCQVHSSSSKHPDCDPIKKHVVDIYMCPCSRTAQNKKCPVTVPVIGP
jgi:hypothetical protein